MGDKQQCAAGPSTDGGHTDGSEVVFSSQDEDDIAETFQSQSNAHDQQSLQFEDSELEIMDSDDEEIEEEMTIIEISDTEIKDEPEDDYDDIDIKEEPEGEDEGYIDLDPNQLGIIVTETELPEDLLGEPVNGEYRCKFCRQKHPNRTSLIAHIDRHVRNGAIRKCRFCDFYTTVTNTLMEHERKHTKERPFQCDVCGHACRVKGDLTRHLLVHTSIKRYKCDVCGHRSRTAGNLKKHKERHDPDLPRNFCCTLCGFAFKRQSALDYHLRRRHSEAKPIFCPHCPFRCKTSWELKSHKAKHSDDHPFECTWPGCGKTFKTRSDCTKHVKRHSGIKNHMCSICGKAFFSSTFLRKHAMAHSDVRNFECGECMKKFKTKGALMSHMKSHMDIKPHQCDVCFKTFSQPSNLTKHMVVHGAGRPYQCPICMHGSREMDHLMTHIGSEHLHSFSYICALCRKPFGKSMQLQFHIQRCHKKEMDGREEVMVFDPEYLGHDLQPEPSGAFDPATYAKYLASESMAMMGDKTLMGNLSLVKKELRLNGVSDDGGLSSKSPETGSLLSERLQLPPVVQVARFGGVPVCLVRKNSGVRMNCQKRGKKPNKWFMDVSLMTESDRAKHNEYLRKKESGRFFQNIAKRKYKRRVVKTESKQSMQSTSGRNQVKAQTRKKRKRRRAKRETEEEDSEEEEAYRMARELVMKVDRQTTRSSSTKCGRRLITRPQKQPAKRKNYPQGAGEPLSKQGCHKPSVPSPSLVDDNTSSSQTVGSAEYEAVRKPKMEKKLSQKKAKTKLLNKTQHGLRKMAGKQVSQAFGSRKDQPQFDTTWDLRSSVSLLPVSHYNATIAAANSKCWADAASLDEHTGSHKQTKASDSTGSNAQTEKCVDDFEKCCAQNLQLQEQAHESNDSSSFHFGPTKKIIAEQNLPEEDLAEQTCSGTEHTLAEVGVNEHSGKVLPSCSDSSEDASILRETTKCLTHVLEAVSPQDVNSKVLLPSPEDIRDACIWQETSECLSSLDDTVSTESKAANKKAVLETNGVHIETCAESKQAKCPLTPPSQRTMHEKIAASLPILKSLVASSMRTMAAKTTSVQEEMSQTTVRSTPAKKDKRNRNGDCNKCLHVLISDVCASPTVVKNLSKFGVHKVSLDVSAAAPKHTSQQKQKAARQRKETTAKVKMVESETKKAGRRKTQPQDVSKEKDPAKKKTEESSLAVAGKSTSCSTSSEIADASGIGGLLLATAAVTRQTKSPAKTCKRAGRPPAKTTGPLPKKSELIKSPSKKRKTQDHSDNSTVDLEQVKKNKKVCDLKDSSESPGFAVKLETDEQDSVELFCVVGTVEHGHTDQDVAALNTVDGSETQGEVSSKTADAQSVAEETSSSQESAAEINAEQNTNSVQGGQRNSPQSSKSLLNANETSTQHTDLQDLVSKDNPTGNQDVHESSLQNKKGSSVDPERTYSISKDTPDRPRNSTPDSPIRKSGRARRVTPPVTHPHSKKVIENLKKLVNSIPYSKLPTGVRKLGIFPSHDQHAASKQTAQSDEAEKPSSDREIMSPATELSTKCEKTETAHGEKAPSNSAKHLDDDILHEEAHETEVCTEDTLCGEETPRIVAVSEPSTTSNIDNLPHSIEEDMSSSQFGVQEGMPKSVDMDIVNNQQQHLSTEAVETPSSSKVCNTVEEKDVASSSRSEEDRVQYVQGDSNQGDTDPDLDLDIQSRPSPGELAPETCEASIECTEDKGTRKTEPFHDSSVSDRVSNKNAVEEQAAAALPNDMTREVEKPREPSVLVGNDHGLASDKQMSQESVPAEKYVTTKRKKKPGRPPKQSVQQPDTSSQSPTDHPVQQRTDAPAASVLKRKAGRPRKNCVPRLDSSNTVSNTSTAGEQVIVSETHSTSAEFRAKAGRGRKQSVLWSGAIDRKERAVQEENGAAVITDVQGSQPKKVGRPRKHFTDGSSKIEQSSNNSTDQNNDVSRAREVRQSGIATRSNKSSVHGPMKNSGSAVRKGRKDCDGPSNKRVKQPGKVGRPKKDSFSETGQEPPPKKVGRPRKQSIHGAAQELQTSGEEGGAKRKSQKESKMTGKEHLKLWAKIKRVQAKVSRGKGKSIIKQKGLLNAACAAAKTIVKKSKNSAFKILRPTGKLCSSVLKRCDKKKTTKKKKKFMYVETDMGMSPDPPPKKRGRKPGPKIVLDRSQTNLCFEPQQMSPSAGLEVCSFGADTDNGQQVSSTLVVQAGPHTALWTQGHEFQVPAQTEAQQVNADLSTQIVIALPTSSLLSKSPEAAIPENTMLLSNSATVQSEGCELPDVKPGLSQLSEVVFQDSACILTDVKPLIDELRYMNQAGMDQLNEPAISHLSADGPRINDSVLLEQTGVQAETPMPTQNNSASQTETSEPVPEATNPTVPQSSCSKQGEIAEDCTDVTHLPALSAISSQHARRPVGRLPGKPGRKKSKDPMFMPQPKDRFDPRFVNDTERRRSCRPRKQRLTDEQIRRAQDGVDSDVEEETDDDSSDIEFVSADYTNVDPAAKKQFLENLRLDIFPFGQDGVEDTATSTQNEVNNTEQSKDNTAGDSATTLSTDDMEGENVPQDERGNNNEDGADWEVVAANQLTDDEVVQDLPPNPSDAETVTGVEGSLHTHMESAKNVTETLAMGTESTTDVTVNLCTDVDEVRDITTDLHFEEMRDIIVSLSTEVEAQNRCPREHSRVSVAPACRLEGCTCHDVKQDVDCKDNIIKQEIDSRDNKYPQFPTSLMDEPLSIKTESMKNADCSLHTPPKPADHSFDNNQTLAEPAVLMDQASAQDYHRNSFSMGQAAAKSPLAQTMQTFDNGADVASDEALSSLTIVVRTSDGQRICLEDDPRGFITS